MLASETIHPPLSRTPCPGENGFCTFGNQPAAVLAAARRWRHTRRAVGGAERAALRWDAEPRRRKRAETSLDEGRDRGQEVRAGRGDREPAAAGHQFRRPERRAIRQRGRGIEIGRDDGLRGLRIDGGDERERSLERQVEQALELELREIAVVARLDGERLDVGALDAGAEHVVLRRASRRLELLDLRQARGRELQVRLLQLGHALGEQCAEIRALDFDREERPALLGVELGGFREAGGCARGGVQSPALKQRLRQIRVGRVGVRLAEHRIHRARAGVVEGATEGAVDAQLRHHRGARGIQLGVGNIGLRGRETNLVADAQSGRDGFLQGKAQRICSGQRALSKRGNGHRELNRAQKQADRAVHHQI